MKKRIISLFVTLCMALSFMPVISLPAHAATITPVKPANGDGTSTNPYQIATPGNLAWFRDNINSGAISNSSYANLTADIDLSGEDNWTPIGTETYKYSAVFNGNNHLIYNMTIRGNAWLGLFGFVYQSNIWNLHIEGEIYGRTRMGGVVAWADSSRFTNCSFSGTILATGDSDVMHVGGLIGWVNGTSWDYIENCYTSGDVSGYGNVGGLVGVVQKPNGGGLSVEYSHSNAKVWAHATQPAGGLIGGIHCYDIRVKDSYFDGSFSDSGTGGSFFGSMTGTLTSTHFHGYCKRDMLGPYSSLSLTHNVDRMLSDTYYGDLPAWAFITADQFTRQENFPGWDFENTWKLEAGDAYPTLRQKVNVATGNSATVTLYTGQDNSYVLPDYFTITQPVDNQFQQHGNRFTYSIESGETVKKTVTGAMGGYAEKDVTVASIAEEKITIHSSVGPGSYPITIKAVDTKGLVPDFTFTLNAVVKEAVPAPRVLSEEFEYSRMMSLGVIYLTEGWQWSDLSICPKDTNTDGYEAYYEFDADDKYYDYTAVTAAGYTVTPYENEDGTHGIKVKLKVPVTRSEESPWDVVFTVKDADTGNPIDGAEITCDYEDEFPYENGNKTDANGELQADMGKGKHNLTISATGYNTKLETVEILPSNTENLITLTLEPTRYTFTAPVVKLKGTETVVEGARVTITKISKNKTDAWNNKSDSIEVDAGSEIGLPNGDFAIRSATYGYTTNDVTYVRINRDAEYDDDKELYYTDDELSASTTKELGSVLHVTKMTEPMYYLNIEKSKIDGMQYTATVSLSNIKATYGTFGIRWDPNLFTLDPDNGGVELGPSIYADWNPTVEEYYGYDTDDDLKWKNENGYYAFVWSAGNNSDVVLDTEPKTNDSGAKVIATFTFTLNGDNDGKLADEITIDSFGIEPWTDTKAAKAYAADLAEFDPDEDPMFWENWRAVDKDNNKRTLKKGRIEESLSVVNGVETGGFFQVAVNGSLGDSDPSSFYDVMTVLHYGFDIKNSVIKFHVTDADTEDNLKDVRLRLFDTGTKLFDTQKTNVAGGATFSVDTSGSNEIYFKYDAALDGYWPLPLSGLIKDRPDVTAETGKTTEVEVKLQKKIYHVPKLVLDASSVTLVQDADLGGEKYAYNGQDFHFRIKGAKGYQITQYPTEAYITIGDSVKNLEINPDSNGLFTLPAEYLNQEPLGSDMFGTEGYEDFLAQPDAEGFRSYNIIVTFNEFKTKELEYIVEGMTNKYGHVTYSYDAGNNELPDDADARSTIDGADDYSYLRVTTHNSTREDGPNHNTGTFTFTANENYMVEKVYINGLRITSYDNLPGFTYSFGTVDMDCSIVVMFWDGTTPSNDSVMTLVVGDYGSVHVYSPKEETDVSLTRRVYLNPSDNLVFDTTPMNGDYLLYKVEKANEGFSRVDITKGEVDGKYTVAPIDGESVTVYVTFRHKDAEITPNVFVKSYVYDGMGSVNPAGILIYSMFDSFEVDLKADKTQQDWKTKGVMISPYEDLSDVSEWDFESLEDENTYRYDSLKTDMAFGAIFVEKSYKLQGYVDLSQGSNVTEAAPKSGAIVTFVRVVDGVEKERQIPVKATTTAARKGAVFTADLPVGDWNVYITKQGYVTYKITDFKFNPILGDDVTYKFGQKDVDTTQVVVPFIGSTKDGSRVTLGDASNIKSGWRDNVNETVRCLADVDNDDKVSVKDMTYVMKNFNQRIVTQKYEDFVRDGSGTHVVTAD